MNNINLSSSAEQELSKILDELKHDILCRIPVTSDNYIVTKEDIITSKNAVFKYRFESNANMRNTIKKQRQYMSLFLIALFQTVLFSVIFLFAEHEKLSDFKLDHYLAILSAAVSVSMLLLAMRQRSIRKSAPDKREQVLNFMKEWNVFELTLHEVYNSTKSGDRLSFIDSLKSFVTIVDDKYIDKASDVQNALEVRNIIVHNGYQSISEKKIELAISNIERLNVNLREMTRKQDKLKQL